MRASFSKMRYDQLDSLRGICAVLIILHHCAFSSYISSSSFIRNSYLFVDFFFVLSGFVIHHNYPRFTATLPALRFAAQRFFRIYPLHFFMLVVFVFLEILKMEYSPLLWSTARYLSTASLNQSFGQNGGSAFLLNVFLLNNLGFRPPSFNQPSWSIAAEFWIYLTYAVFALLTSRLKRHLKLTLMIVIAGAYFAALARAPGISKLDQWNNYLSLARCVFGFFLGAALNCWLAANSDQGATRLGLFLQLSILIATFSAISIFGTRPPELVLPLVFAALIASLVFWPSTIVVKVITTRPLLWLGKVSYSIYMVHMIVLTLVHHSLVTRLHAIMVGDEIMINPLLGSALNFLCVIVVLILSVATCRWIETPGRAFGRRLLSRLLPEQQSSVARHSLANDL